jgi:hypothetical protein
MERIQEFKMEITLTKAYTIQYTEILGYGTGKYQSFLLKYVLYVYIKKSTHWESSPILEVEIQCSEVFLYKITSTENLYVSWNASDVNSSIIPSYIYSCTSYRNSFASNRKSCTS